MSDDYKLQFSVSVPHSGSDYAKADMLNVRANSPEELAHYLNAFADASLVQKAAEAAANLRAAYLVVRDMGAQVVPQGAPSNPATAPQNAPQQAGGYQGQQQGYAPQNAPEPFQQPQPSYGQPEPQGGYGQGGYQGGQQQPSGNGVPTTPPPHVGPAPSCSHGTRQFLAKPYKNGKPGYWMAWACPAHKDDPSQHGLDFIQQKR